MLLLILAQAAVATAPDIELHATIDAKSVRIEKQGTAKLAVQASPDAGSLVKVEAPKANGAKTLHDVHVTVDAAAKLSGNASIDAEMGQPPPEATTAPQPR